MGKSQMSRLKKAASKTARFGSAYFVTELKVNNNNEQAHTYSKTR